MSMPKGNLEGRSNPQGAFSSEHTAFSPENPILSHALLFAFLFLLQEVLLQVQCTLFSPALQPQSLRANPQIQHIPKALLPSFSQPSKILPDAAFAPLRPPSQRTLAFLQAQALQWRLSSACGARPTQQSP